MAEHAAERYEKPPPGTRLPGARKRYLPCRARGMVPPGARPVGEAFGSGAAAIGAVAPLTGGLSMAQQSESKAKAARVARQKVGGTARTSAAGSGLPSWRLTSSLRLSRASNRKP